MNPKSTTRKENAHDNEPSHSLIFQSLSLPPEEISGITQTENSSEWSSFQFLPFLPEEILQTIFYKLTVPEDNAKDIFTLVDVSHNCPGPCGRKGPKLANFIKPLTPLLFVSKSWNVMIRSFFAKSEAVFHVHSWDLASLASTITKLGRVSCLWIDGKDLDVAECFDQSCLFSADCLTVVFTDDIKSSSELTNLVKKFPNITHLALTAPNISASDAIFNQHNKLKHVEVRHQGRPQLWFMKPHHQSFYNFASSKHSLKYLFISHEWWFPVYVETEHEKLPDLSMYPNLEHVCLDVDNRDSYILSTLQNLEHLRILELRIREFDFNLIWNMHNLVRLVLRVCDFEDSDVNIDLNSECDPTSFSHFGWIIYSLGMTAHNACIFLRIELDFQENSFIPKVYPIINRCVEKTGATIVVKEH